MIHVLENIPWGYKHPAVQYWKTDKISIYKGNFLPDELIPYMSQDFSYARWKEDEINGIVQPPENSANRYALKEHQRKAAESIYKHFSSGSRGFLLADKTGLGKTLSGLAGITASAKSIGFDNANKAKLLIVCPKSAIPQWRNTIRAYPSASMICRIMIINYHQLNKLLEAPAKARVAKKRATKNRQTAREGKPTIDWDFVIFDESHYLKNYGKSAVSMSATNVAQLNSSYIKGKKPFVLFSTATPGATPIHMSIMAGILAPLIEKGATSTPSTWGQFLKDRGFNVDKGKNGWVWKEPFSMNKNSKDPAKRREYLIEKELNDEKQKRDTKRIGRALSQKGSPFIMRSPNNIAGWPEQKIIPMPVELEPGQAKIYKEIWEVFRQFLMLPASKKTSQSKLVETLRYKQKSSLLKVYSLIEFIEDLVDSGNQVYISCQFLETIDRYHEMLNKKGIKTSEISGRYEGAERERQRLMFQKGETSVALCTVTEALSLHASESLPDGTKATSKPRITVIHDIRANPNDTIQSLGRAHRDGQNSITYFPYFEKTVDQNILDVFINRDGNMKTMTGDEENRIERIFNEAAARTKPPKQYS